MDFTQILPDRLYLRIFKQLDLGERSRCERVGKRWRKIMRDIFTADTRVVWMYIVFRRHRSSGHNRPIINISHDGPIFWNKQVVYIYACACHYLENHEPKLMALCRRIADRIQRVCLVDHPVNYPFMTDGFFHYAADHFSQLQFIYIRELDLESVNFPTIEKLARHPTLKKVILHHCRQFEVFQDFGGLPQLLVVKGEIVGLKALLGDIDGLSISDTSSESSEAPSTSAQTVANNGNV